MSFNKLILVGNLGKDPELRYTPQGTAVTTFSLATNERRKNREGEMEDHTEWFEVTIFGKQAETASKYLAKGRPVYIEGRLSTDIWQDRDGKTRVTLKVRATDMNFIGGNGNGEQRAAAAGAGASAVSGGAASSAQPEAELSDDDIPF